MKAVILAGGYGTRLKEETEIRPKPMVEIGGYPIIWHIMKIYFHYGIKDFIICLGYKGNVIKEYFYNYFLNKSDITMDMDKNNIYIHNSFCESWKITFVDTGEGTLTGGRLKRVENYINNETFCLTYGDAVGNINIKELIEFHKKQKTWATLTTVNIPERYGYLNLDSNYKVLKFTEKPTKESNFINAGFFVFEPNIFQLIQGDMTMLEKEPLEELSRIGQLSAYQHKGFWHPMDTLKDKIELEKLWISNANLWKLW